MGIEPFLVASSVVAVLAQRLLRKVCPDCKQPYHPDDEELIRLGSGPAESAATFYRGAGCPACSQTGYRGRTGIFELLVLDDEIRRFIGNKADSAAIKQAAIAKGMVTLKEEGAEKVFHGMTTTEEVMRITQQEVEDLADARLSIQRLSKRRRFRDRHRRCREAQSRPAEAAERRRVPH